MATDQPVDAGAPNLNLTNDEKRVYGQLFRQADSNGIGVVTGEVAVKFFEKTKLDSRVLGEIWQIADKENRGFLTPAGFGIVLRLIGHAQAGREPSAELALQTGPLPHFDGFAPAPAAPSPQPALATQATGGGPIRIPPLTPEKATQYAALFQRQSLQSGNMLAGDAAKSIFEKSGLPNEMLGRIWQLADTEQRGSLVLTEFVIAMHLLTSVKTGMLRGLPNILPAALYEAATRRVPDRGSPTTSVPPVPAIPRQLSGPSQQQQMRTGSPLSRQPIAAPPMVTQAPSAVGLTPQSTTLSSTTDWLVTPQDKARYDQLYDGVDTQKRGFITGVEAVDFFSQSKLAEDVLAQVWDLADINSEGQLNRDEFAVAMYLIREQRKGNPLPAALPPSLIPPSLRRSVFDGPAPAAAAAAAAVAAPPLPPQPKSALVDLFELATSAPPHPPADLAAAPQTAMATGGSNASRDPFSSTSPLQPGSPVASIIPQTSGASSFKPFVPSSSFGLSLTQHKTGESTGSAPAKLDVPSRIEEDLLGDTDPEISKKLTNETAELANMSNQIGTLSKQMQELQTKRNSTQHDLNQASAQKKNFETRLSQLRTMYEKEAAEVKALQAQLEAAKSETKKLSVECAMLDGTHQDLVNQKNQVLSGLQADQQENAGLKEKIRAINAEIAALRPQIERLKSEARQQKGLVAINKKQLSTNEGERDKLKAEVEDLAKSNEELSRQISSASPVSSSVQIASPAPSTTSANNPFFRRTASTDVVGVFASPSVKPFNDKTIDDLFGPIPEPSTSSPPPTTPFKHKDPGTSSNHHTPASSSPQVSRAIPAVDSSAVPAPPESKQITSGYPPFGEPAEPLSSSRQVSPPTSRLVMTDAAPSEASTGPKPLEPAATGQSAASGSAIASVSDKEAPKPISTFSSENKPSAADDVFGAAATEDASKGPVAPADPFAGMDQAKAKDAFDKAFANIRPPKNSLSQEKQPDKSISAFNAEFPPISELERDDSDSDTDKGGFDDDFTPASPQGTKNAEKKVEKSGEAEENIGKSEAVTTTTMPNTNTAPSSSGLTATAVDRNLEDFFAAGPPSVTASTHTIPAHTAGPAPAATTLTSLPMAATNATAITASSQPKSSTPFDDLDDDFEGLEDAKEGSADDDFATISRSGLDDFNPVFDSSPPPSQAKSESTAFGAESFDFANMSEASGPHHSGNNLASSAAIPAATSGTTTASTAAKTPLSPADNHDWEALFAGLDSPGSDTTAKVAAKDANKESERPGQPGRALTEEGVHDDPTLKQLMAMGYPRADALEALEKSNYDPERAVEILLSK